MSDEKGKQNVMICWTTKEDGHSSIAVTVLDCMVVQHAKETTAQLGGGLQEGELRYWRSKLSITQVARAICFSNRQDPNVPTATLHGS